MDVYIKEHLLVERKCIRKACLRYKQLTATNHYIIIIYSLNAYISYVHFRNITDE